jgi:hypothetical protein
MMPCVPAAPSGYPPRMDSDRAAEQGTEEDRVVSRRVDNPTRARPGDQDAYAAADPTAEPEPDRDGGGSGGAAERAARDMDGENEDEPTRSE